MNKIKANHAKEYFSKSAYESMLVILSEDDRRAEARKAKAEARKAEARKAEANAHVHAYHRMEAEARKAKAEARKAEARKEWKEKEAEAQDRKEAFLQYMEVSFCNRRGVSGLQDMETITSPSAIMVTACSIARQAVKIRRDHVKNPSIYQYLNTRYSALGALRNSIDENGNIYQNVISCNMGAWNDALDLMSIAQIGILEEYGNMFNPSIWKNARRVSDSAIYRKVREAKYTSTEEMTIKEENGNDETTIYWKYEARETMAEDLEEIVKMADLTETEKAYFDMRMTGASYPQIAEIYGKKSHQSIIRTVNKAIGKIRKVYMEIYDN